MTKTIRRIRDASAVRRHKVSPAAGPVSHLGKRERGFVQRVAGPSDVMPSSEHAADIGDIGLNETSHERKIPGQRTLMMQNGAGLGTR